MEGVTVEGDGFSVAEDVESVEYEFIAAGSVDEDKV
jgi:hypothetical protein